MDAIGSAGWISLTRPAWLTARVWPFATQALEIDGCKIAVTDVGRGPTLVFVHTGFWSFLWRDVMERLQTDFRCVCFDAPGAGRSARLALDRISLQKAARTLSGLIERLDLTDVTLVFHDLGGPSAIAGGARVAGRIAGLCAVNTFAWPPEGLKFRGMLRLMGSAGMREFSARTGLLGRITASSFGVGRHMDPESRAAFLDGIGPSGLRTFHAYMRDVLSSPACSDAEAALRGPFRGLPLLTIFGERNDPLRFQPRWRALFPQARQVVVPNGNHFPMCDAPELVSEEIRRWHRDRVVRFAGARIAG